MPCSWWVFNATGPRHRGRSAAHWFTVYASYDPNYKRTAIHAFQTMSSNAVPMLIAELESPPSRFAYVLNSWLNRVRSVPMDYNQQFNWRKERACHLLREIGDPARAAIPALAKASTNGMWYIATSAHAALIKLRHEPLTPYFELLKDKSDALKWYPTAMLLGYCGTNASPAIPLLLKSLQDSNTLIQAHALTAIGMIECEPQACVPAVIPFLTNADVALRHKAYYALLAFKEHAQTASDQIILGLTDADPWIRNQALLACLEILPPADQRRARPQAEALLDDPNSFVRDSAKKLLPKIRASAVK